MPTDWEAKYQAGETPWDKGAASPGLVEFLGNAAAGQEWGRVLVPGCGLGHDARVLCPVATQVVGIDIAPSAVAAAAKAENPANVEYAVADLFDLPEPLQGTFNTVWEHTCFCAIDPSQRPAYVEAVATALRPGGRLLAVFYLDPGNDSPEEGPPFEVSIAELDRLFLARFELLQEWSPNRAYSGREGREWMRLMQLRPKSHLL